MDLRAMPPAMDSDSYVVPPHVKPPSVSIRAVRVWPLYGVSMSSGGLIRPDAMRSRSVTLRQGEEVVETEAVGAGAGD